MTPAEMLTRILDPACTLLHSLGGPPPSDPARVFLLAVAQQESGADLTARYQGSPSPSPGPARGWLQFEQGGAVHGVMTHAASKGLARALCDSLTVAWNEPAVWRAIEGNDMLAGGFGRLLLFTDPYAIPIHPTSAWAAYDERLWRPGKPHPETWETNWNVAVQTVKAHPLTQATVA